MERATIGYLINEAAKARANGSLTKARRFLSRALEIDPDNLLAMRDMAVVISDSGKNVSGASSREYFMEAVSLYKKILHKNPNDSAAWGNMANVLTDLGDYKEALKCYDRAIKLKPDDWLFVMNKGMAYVDLRDKKGAKKFLTKVPSLLPKEFGDLPSARVFYNMGVGLMGVGEPELALSYFEKSIKFNPRYPEAWQNRGMMYMRIRHNPAWKKHARESFLKARDLAKKAYNDTVVKKAEMALELLGKQS